MRTLIAANWKMHGGLDWVAKTAEFDKILPQGQRGDIDVLICPPTLYVAAMAKNEDGVLIGAQNCHHAFQGAHTGEISSAMLRDAGVHYVIVGHSERRAQGETDADVNAKADAATTARLTPIVCVGESLKQRQAGQASNVVEHQLIKSLPDDLDDYVVAYEPIWAIGTGEVPTLSDIKDMHTHIRNIVGKRVRILYGGSVKPANAQDILGTKNVNGALIGGASLEMESLAAIARAAMD
jgi:triosephosphate isomerase